MATARALGSVWDFYMRSYYAHEARGIAKRETRRWYLTLVLMGKTHGADAIASSPCECLAPFT